VAERDPNITEEQLRLLVDSITSQAADRDRAKKVANMLIRETVRFRDKLKQDTGEILTVGDTRIALKALDQHLNGLDLPADLTPEQKALTQIWIDRLTLFGS
jgi:hypothetical protein